MTCVVIGICLGSVISQAEVVEADTSAATADVDSRAPGPYRNGTFTGSAPGYNDDMTVQVTIKTAGLLKRK